MKEKTLQELADDPSLFHIVYGIEPLRPGGRLFSVKLEYEHYEPDTARNDLFQMRFTKLDEMLLAIITIPLSEKHIAEKVAEETGMRLADGIPFVMGELVKITGNTRPEYMLEETKKDAKFLHMNSPRVFSLENASNSNVYKGGNIGPAHIKEFEEAKMQDIFAAFKVKWLKNNPGEEFPGD